MTARDTLIEHLQPIIGAVNGLEDVRLIKSGREIDRLSQPVLIVRTTNLQRLVSTPMGARATNYTLVLVSPHTDVDLAEKQLDELLEALLPALSTSQLTWTAATQTQYDLEHLAYDISVSSIAR